MKKTIALAIACTAMFARTHAQSASRLIAESWLVNYTGTYQLADTANYFYSGSRGGDLTHTLKYDSLITQADTAGTLTPVENTQQTFDANNNILSFTQKNRIAGSDLQYNFQLINTYNAENEMTSQLTQLWDTSVSGWQNGRFDTFVYYATGNQLSDLTQFWSSGILVNSYIHTYTYNAENEKLTDTTQLWNATTSSWNNAFLTEYTYTSFNKPDSQNTFAFVSGSYVGRGIRKYWYNTSDSVIGIYSYQYGGDTTKDSFTYDGSGNLIAEASFDWIGSSASWFYIYGYLCSNFNSFHQPQLALYGYNSTTSADSIYYSGKDSILYNTFGQKTAIYHFGLSGSAWVVDSAGAGELYYYGAYTSAVQNIQNTACTANVYPVPAKDQLHVSVTWDQPQAFTIQIIDMQGRTLSQWSMPEQTTYEGSITTSNLPAGNYLLKISGTSAQSVSHIIIAAQ